MSMEKFDVVISSKAQSDLASVVGFVLNVSKEAARALTSTIYPSIESLWNFPERYPVFPMPKSTSATIRKCVVSRRYALLYSMEGNSAVILRILDSRKEFDFLVD